LNLADVNVLVGALMTSAQSHHVCRAWFEAQLNSSNLFAVSKSVLASVTRISTNPKIHRQPAALKDALTFANLLLEHPRCIEVEPGARHWGLFTSLCTAANAHGNLITDAWLAALAIEHGCTLVTLDRDFLKFPGLSHTSPLIAP
jgi:uncharacterized protein